MSTVKSGDADALEDRTWLLSPDAPLGVALGAISVTAHFRDGRLTGRSGCNTYFTSYQVDSGSLTIGPHIASTSMACGPAETAVETAYLARLPRAAGYQIAGDALTIIDHQGDLILEFEAIDGAEAIQGQWTVTSYYAGDSVTSVLGGVIMTAEFSAYTVTGNTGCNTFTGPYEIDGAGIAIGPLSSTHTAGPTAELTLQETNYLNALQLATSFEVTAGRLDLLREGGTYAVIFQAH